ncbi:radical SAM family heme chaperone HemW [Porticoccus sp. W117]|uniref:radical SAM family heme chaperone HemW n=1 Tax=Porticoccus sp. W117 TaxID=3054777 RepID=UPI00259422E7|nr:radical SAM family heme chaperone HemW [Porticoccus sp. W117]MDM3872037.1 radical SAM family heme chaperone HemW [Porticoccus sp. W117]
MLLLPPLSLYIHIPWCVRKCPYCDFNSHAAGGDIPEKQYVAALLHDLKNDLPYVQGRRIHSIFFGGGTPSLFSASAIEMILQGVEQEIGFDGDIEITLEANPGTFEQEKFAGFRAAGINRLSIGIQSFDDLHLQQLGRIHSAREAHTVASMARAAGFDNFNLDLMHGLPGQTEEDALNDLRQAIAIEPNHLSWYQLTIEPNTAFYRQPPQLPKDSVLEAISDRGQQLLAESGFQQYEVSAYCRNKQASQHNLNYWQFGDYLGIGAGAHGKITLLNEQKIVRTRKTRTPKDYFCKEKNFCAAADSVLNEQLPVEFLMNALRLNRGVDAAFFENYTGLSLDSIKPAWQQLQRRKLMVDDSQRLQPTATGHRFLNSLLEAFL